MNGNRLTSSLPAIVNVVVLVLILAAILVGVGAVSQDADAASCRVPPAAVQATRSEPGRATTAARTKLARAQAAARRSPGDVTRQKVRAARTELRQQVARSRLWNRVHAVVSVPDTSQTVFDLGHDINASRRSIKFDLSRRVPGRYLPVSIHPFTSTSGGSQLDGEEIKAWARLDGSRESGVLTFCVVPEARTSSSAAAGVFAGDFAFAGTRLEYSEIPVTFSAPYPKTGLVALVGIAICLAASVYVFILRMPNLPALTLYGKEVEPTEVEQDEAMRALRMRFGFVLAYWRWMTGYSGLVTFTAGLIGAVAVFRLQYLASDSWSGSDGEWLTYCGAVASAFIAAGTTGRLAQNKYADPPERGRRRDGDSDRPDDGHPRGDPRDRDRAQRGTAQETPVKASPATRTATKAPARKTPAKKTPAKKTLAKKTLATTAKKAGATRATAASRPTASKAPAARTAPRAATKGTATKGTGTKGTGTKGAATKDTATKDTRGRRRGP